MNRDMQTDTHEGSLVVFVLGMSPGSLWRWAQSIFVSRSMFRMQSELERDRANDRVTGYLGGFNAMSLSGPVVVQYWRSFEDLESYSHDMDFAHRPAWLKFYKMTHDARVSRVGLWHETYRVPTKSHESIYVDLRTPVGLGAAVGTQELTRRGRTSRERLTT